MTLGIVDDNGDFHAVDDAIDEYNLAKPMARSTICDKIKDVLDDLLYDKRTSAKDFD